MKVLFRLAGLMFRAGPVAFLRGAGLGLAVLAMGALLLGLSGWFVTASAAAGLAGAGAVFDFFRPSAGVRFLALGRAAARYGERMLTHDATLRALASLRGRLFAGVTRLPWETQARLREAEALNRLTADVDALDGLLVRLVLPAISVLAVLAAAYGLLHWLVAPAVAAVVTGAFVAGGGVALWQTARAARDLSERDETALQDLRARALDLCQTRADLAVAGALQDMAQGLDKAIADVRQTRNGLDRIERAGGAAIATTTGIAAAGALAVGGQIAARGDISAAAVAIGVFAALALGEGLAALRRGLAEIGRMETAGARVLALIETPDTTSPKPMPDLDPAAPALSVRGLAFRRAGTTKAGRAIFGPLDLDLRAGQTLVLGGPSGVGKSTLLAVLAGLIAPTEGTVRIADVPLADWPDAALRAKLVMVPQRARLIAGTIGENLRLAAPDATDADLWQVIDAVALGPALRARDGLATLLGPGGSGLSGGQTRRLCLARAALCRPVILLLDEPTEGLDPATARATLDGLRSLLPDSALLIVSHHAVDFDRATRSLTLSRPET